MPRHRKSSKDVEFETKLGRRSSLINVHLFPISNITNPTLRFHLRTQQEYAQALSGRTQTDTHKMRIVLQKPFMRWAIDTRMEEACGEISRTGRSRAGGFEFWSSFFSRLGMPFLFKKAIVEITGRSSSSHCDEWLSLPVKTLQRKKAVVVTIQTAAEIGNALQNPARTNRASALGSWGM